MQFIRNPFIIWPENPPPLYPNPPSIQVAERQLPLILPPLDLGEQQFLLPITRFAEQTAAVRHGIVAAYAGIDTLAHALKTVQSAPRQLERSYLANRIRPSNQDELVFFLVDGHVEEFAGGEVGAGVVVLRFE